MMFFSPFTFDKALSTVLNAVVGVIENNTNSGYVRKTSIAELTPGSYYYNKNTKDLYIKNSSNSDPNNDEIIVQTI